MAVVPLTALLCHFSGIPGDYNALVAPLPTSVRALDFSGWLIGS